MGSVVELQETRSLINIIDDDAAKEPNRPFIFIRRSNRPQDGWEPVTYGQMANAVNHVAHTIKKMAANHIQEDKFPIIAYIGPNGVRYIIIMLACIKARCKVFFTSPQKTIEGQLSLLEATDCLAQFLFRSISPSDEQDISGSYHAQQIKDMQNMVEKYTRDLPEHNKAQINPNDTDQTVIVTGTTGSLGSYILDQLVSSPRVSKVYALTVAVMEAFLGNWS
ncbi:hypothetical protein V8C34DRAFT_309030 [Trichoderma compactum]